MDPLTYASRLTQSHDRKSTSLEFVALGIFFLLYVFVRLCESYIIPSIPEFIRDEIKALFRWSPVILPVIFGLTYFKDKSWSKKYEGLTIDDDDEVLRRRMWAIFEK